MVAVPATTPETTPVTETAATPVTLLLQVPPLVVSVKAKVVPVQTVGEAGEIAAGPASTVTTLVTAQVPML